MNIGYPRIAHLADVSPATVQRLCAGVHPVIRRDIAAKLLAVEPKPALGSRIPAHPTWRLLRLIKRELYSRAEIAQALGRRRLRIERQLLRPGKQPVVRWPTFCTVSTALKVRRLYRSTQAEEDPDQ